MTPKRERMLGTFQLPDGLVDDAKEKRERAIENGHDRAPLGEWLIDYLRFEITDEGELIILTEGE